MTQHNIFRLAKEAGAYWEHGDFNMPIPVGFYNEKDLIRFAQLIAQKCAEIAETAEPYQAADLIRKHFGVEE